MPDELDELLRPTESGPSPARDRVLRRTLAVQRRRRWRRPVPWVVAVAAGFVLGVGSVVRPPPPEPLSPPVATPVEPVAEPSALELEWQAMDSPTPRPDWFVRAGDIYLTRHRDAEAALRCYRRALDDMAGDDLAIGPADSWLMVTLKTARRQEVNRVRIPR